MSSQSGQDAKRNAGESGKYPLGSLGLQILDHWRQYCPTMYRELKREGKLEERVYRAQEMTADAYVDLIQHGVPEHMAWEAVREEWAFIRAEES
jgi:hypothetical protein